MGVLLGNGTANFVFTISSVFLFTRFSIAERLLEGLCVFHAYSGEGDQNQEKPAHRGNSKTARWLNKSAVRQKIFIDGAENVVKARLPLGAFRKCVHHEELEILVFAAITVIGNALVCASPLTDIKFASISWILMIASAVPFVVLFLLAKVEVLASIVSRNDKKYVCFACVILSALAFGAMQLPPGVLDFDWDASAQDLTQAVTDLRQKVHVFPETVETLPLPTVGLKGIVAILAGLLAGCTMPAALRASRSYLLAVQAPPATSNHTSIGWWGCLRLQLAFLFPFLLSIAWFRPMIQDTLQVSEGLVDVGRAILLLACSGAFYAAIRPFLKGYLSSGLVVWWTYKHAMTSWDQNSRIGDLIQLRVRNINVLMCKVAIEFLAPAVLWTALGSLLFYSNVTRGSVPGYEWLLEKLNLQVVESSDTSVPIIAAANVCGFLAWWTSICWSVGVSVFLSLFRTGMLTEV